MFSVCYDLFLIFQGRHNVLLLGDSLSDTRMTAGLERVDHVIKIGFLNHDVSKLVFTVLVLFNSGGMLREIFSSPVSNFNFPCRRKSCCRILRINLM